MIDLEKLYNQEEVRELTGKNDIYLHCLIREKKMRGVWVKRFIPHVKGKDLVRYLQGLRWGRKLLKSLGQPELPEEFFKEDDIAELESELEALKKTRERRSLALQITVGKIHDIQKKIAEMKK